MPPRRPPTLDRARLQRRSGGVFVDSRVSVNAVFRRQGLLGVRRLESGDHPRTDRTRLRRERIPVGGLKAEFVPFVLLGVDRFRWASGADRRLESSACERKADVPTKSAAIEEPRDFDGRPRGHVLKLIKRGAFSGPPTPLGLTAPASAVQGRPTSPEALNDKRCVIAICRLFDRANCASKRNLADLAHIDTRPNGLYPIVKLVGHIDVQTWHVAYDTHMRIGAQGVRRPAVARGTRGPTSS